MDINFSCDKCGQHIVIDQAGAGTTIECPQCAVSMTVPSQPIATTKLTACPDCGREVSKRAESCPHCGAPLAISPRSTAALSEITTVPRSTESVAQAVDKFPENLSESFDSPDQPKAKKSRAGVVLLVIVLVVGGGFMALKFLQARAEANHEEALYNFRHSLQKTIEEKNLAALKAGKARISMTKTDVLRSLGSPTQRDAITDQLLRQYIEEMWLYGDKQVSFGYDGKVRSLSAELDFDEQ